MLDIDIKKLNIELKNKSPEDIITWAIQLNNQRILTTSFGTYSAVLLSTFNKIDENITVVWCDTFLNKIETYNHARNLIDKFNLNINIYFPNSTKKEIQELYKKSTIDSKNHQRFSEIVKLEPFRRALKIHQPKIWFTNIRERQTKYRNSKDILSYSKDGILKISPFYYWSDKDLDNYLKKSKLPKNETYFDPVKILSNRECGIHFQ